VDKNKKNIKNRKVYKDMQKQFNCVVLATFFVLFSISFASASSMSWNFSTPSDYIYNSSSIIVNAGTAYLNGSIVLNPYAQWHFNETSGTVASDNSGNGRNGNTVNSPTWVVGKINNSINLAGGSSQYINMGNIANFEYTLPFSYEVWFNTGNSQGIIFSKYDSVNGRGPILYMFGGKIEFGLYSSNSPYQYAQIDTTAATFGDSAWHHLVATYNGSGNVAGMKIYIDGLLKTVTTNSDTLAGTILNSVDFVIGKTTAGVSYWTGKLDEALIYENKTLTQAEVTYRYNSGTGTEKVSDYPITNPTIYSKIPFIFANPIQTVSETATKPAGTAIKYHSSFDNGTIWNYWNGSNWIVTDNSYTQANIINDLITNIDTLNSSGLLLFRALLNSNGDNTPSLDNFYASDTLSYPQISNVTASPIGYNNATIIWTTDLSSNSSVIYGLSVDNLNLSNGNPSLVTSHTVSLSSLLANTSYYYNVTSCIGIACNSTGTYNFTTLVTPPAPNLTIGSIVQLISLYKQNTAADIKIACFDSNNNYCTNGVTCSLTIFNPDSSTLISNQQMTYNPTFFSYNLNTSQTNDLGTYTGTVLCSSTNNVNSEIEYQVTPNGQISSVAQSGLSIGILLSIALTMFFFAFLAFKLMDYEKTFSIAIFFFVLSIILSLFGLYLGLVYSRDYLSSTTAEPQSALFIGVLYGLMGLMFIGLLWLILAVIKEFKIRKSERDHGENWDHSTKSYRY